MRYSIRQYAKALFSSLKGKPSSEREKVISRFLTVLRRNRDVPRLQLILKEAEKEELKALGLRKVLVESAAKLSGGLKKEVEKILGENILLEEKIKPDLLAGITFLINDEILIDASAKRQIEKMFVK